MLINDGVVASERTWEIWEKKKKKKKKRCLFIIFFRTKNIFIFEYLRNLCIFKYIHIDDRHNKVIRKVTMSFTGCVSHPTSFFTLSFTGCLTPN